MNSTFADALAAELATMTRVTEPASAPLGYGGDLSCTSDVTEDFAELDPESPKAIIQALIRRLTTPRGALADDADYGFDIRPWCNRGVTLADLRTLSAQMAAECRKDDRVASVRIDVTSATTTLASGVLACTIMIAPVNPATQDFTLTFSATDAGVLIDTIGVTSGA
jgi:hypothetical protein